MKLDGKIEFEQDWVLSLRNEETLPVAAIKEILEKEFGDELTILREDFAFLSFTLKNGTCDGMSHRIVELMRNRFQLGDGRQVHESATMIYSIFPEALLVISEMPNEVSETSPLSCLDSLVGWDALKEFCREINLIAPQIKSHNTQISFQNMNLLISVNDGCGLTTALNTYVDFITGLGLFPFNRDESVSELKLGQKSEDGVYSAYDIVSALAKVESRNKLVCFDISAYTERARHNELKEFLRMLLPYETDYLFAFRVLYIEPTSLKRLQDVISDILSLRTLSIPPYTTEQLKQGAALALRDYSFCLADNAWDVFYSRVAEEKSDGRFYGMQSVRKIVCEILWLKHLHDAQNKTEDEPLTDNGLTVISKQDILALSSTYQEKQSSGFDELDEMIGMETISERIREIVSQVRFSLNNNSLERPCLHMRFVGAPGTGKTSVARILGRIFAENGILRNGYFFEYMSRDLCGEFVGQTSPKTSSICRDAYGSVLFIDEAYGLYTGESGTDFGKEALTTLISEMENHRDDMVVIMAGYKEDMDKLMEGNAGLRSRMPFQLEFPNYTKEQLAQIFMQMVTKHFTFEPDLEKAVTDFFRSLDQAYLDSKDFANARFVRNLYERTWSKAAIRSQLSGSDSVLITVDDFIVASSEQEFSENLNGTEHKLGFL